MSEEEIIEEATEETAETAEETEEEEVPIDIDVNAALLEAMVKRTEILEKLAQGSIDSARALQELEAVAVPATTSRRRKRRK